MINLVKNKNFQKVLGSNKKRYLKIPEKFNDFSHGDIAEIISAETDNEIQIVYRFKIVDLKEGKEIKIKQEISKQIEIEQEILELKKAELKRAELIKANKICEFCDKLINIKVVKFVNVEQNPVHYFCNKQCKFNWIYKKQQGN